MASNRPSVIDSTSYSLGIALRQIRLSIKIQITWLNNNLLGYLLKYKSLLPPPVKLLGPQAYNIAVYTLFFLLDHSWAVVILILPRPWDRFCAPGHSC